MSNRISVPKIMQSPAGFYIGTSYTEFIHDNFGEIISQYEVPYSRLSDYFTNQTDLEFMLIEVLDKVGAGLA